MLSRVAQHIYWLARYIERAEDIARLINVNTHLRLDLPRAVRPGWEPLIFITGSTEPFNQRATQADERSVVHFLISDSENPGSILGSIQAARENARTIRDFISREAWEQINELFLTAKSRLQSGLSQGKRYDYLKSIILGAQQLTGLLRGTMLHDAGFQFLRMGFNLERADMTTRIIDVRSANLLPNQSENLKPFDNIQWMSVLKSMTAYQMYRRHLQVAVNRTGVLRFLLQNPALPRSFYHCMGEVELCLNSLPRSEVPLRTLLQIKRTVSEANPQVLEQNELHQFIDDLQLGLGELHNQISATYFEFQPATAIAAQSQSQAQVASPAQPAKLAPEKGA